MQFLYRIFYFPPSSRNIAVGALLFVFCLTLVFVQHIVIEKNSFVIDKSWYIHESPCLNRNWLDGNRLFIMKYSNKLLYIKRSNIFPHIGRYETGWQFLETCLSPFLWTGTTIAFFHSLGKLTFFDARFENYF